jgi:GntR family transcriptional regulator
VKGVISLNFRDSTPIYEQIKNSFRELIIAGIMQPDEKLPSVRELASELSLNPNTIQRAYTELEAEGYIYSIQGKGNYVSVREYVSGDRKERLLQNFVEIATELIFLGEKPEDLRKLIGAKEIESND